MAARGRAWTRSACPPATPAARQTARASLPLTAPTRSRTRSIIPPIGAFVVTSAIFGVCESLKLLVLRSCSCQNPPLTRPSTPWTPAPPQPAAGLLSPPRITGLPARTGGPSPSRPCLPARPVRPRLTTRRPRTRASSGSAWSTATGTSTRASW